MTNEQHLIHKLTKRCDVLELSVAILGIDNEIHRLRHDVVAGYLSRGRFNLLYMEQQEIKVALQLELKAL